MTDTATGNGSLSIDWSYRPGEWYVIFGARATVALPPTQKDTVAELWPAVDGGADFTAVLDALLAKGLSRLPAFAVISAGEASTRVLVRGESVRAEVSDASGPTVLDGAAGGTWTERDFDDLSALSIVFDARVVEQGYDDESGAAALELPILTGLVRANGIDQPARTSVAVATAAGSADEATPLEPSPLEADSVPQVAPADPDEPVVEPVDAGPPTELMEPLELPTEAPEDEVSGAVLVPPPGGDPLVDPLVPESEVQESAPAGWVTPWDAPGPTAGQDQEGDTRPPAPAFPPPASAPSVPPVPPVPPAPPLPPPLEPPSSGDAPPPLGIGAWEPIGGFEPPDDHDGHTRAGVEDPVSAPEPPPSGAVAKLLFSDGQTITVDGVVLIGRAPEARRFLETEQPQLVAVLSRLHEISSTHIEVRPGVGADQGTAVVTDMGSTNGTVLVQPGLGAEDLKPGIAVALIPGATINLGDGITIQVARP